MDKNLIQKPGLENGNSPEKNGSDLIVVKGLYKSFKSHGYKIEVLKDLDMKLKKGESVAVTGPSGIGKSTLLHILGTLDQPDKGVVLFENHDVFNLDNGKLAKFRNESIGFVFQFHHLLYEFTALENVMMPVLIRGDSRKKAEKMAKALLVRVGLEKRLSQRVNRLSGGEQQRVALARALVLNPPLLLADEPTGNLDKKNSEQVHELLCELNREMGMTLVVVTHSMELSAHMSRRITIVDGKLRDSKYKDKQ